jgi:hypothetical protein
MNKKAISLSINTLVIIIISLVILGSGLALLNKFLTQAKEFKGDLDQRTQEELERLLVDQGRRVALPLHTAVLPAGEEHLFGLGIMNINSKAEFKIKVELSRFVDEQDQIRTNEIFDEANSWLLYFKEPITIEENEPKKEKILVQIPGDAPKGQYIYNVKVFKEPFTPDSQDANQYGNTQKIVLTVR